MIFYNLLRKPSKLIALFFLGVTLFTSGNLQAKIFRNAYISFELPAKWKCKIDGTEWICNSSFKKQSREAIIVLTAKEAGPSDNLRSYNEHLKKVRILPSKSTKAVRSKVLHMKNRKVSGQTWIDSLHKNSEIPNYYTRYVATIKNRVAILVTFSAHIKHYTKYSSDFFKAIQSLRVVTSKDIMKQNSNGLSGSPTGGTGEMLGLGDGLGAAGDLGDEFPDEIDDESSDSQSKMLGIGLLFLAVVGYLLMKIKK